MPYEHPIMNHEQASQILNDAVAKLAEVFDHVNIMASWDECGYSNSARQGAGNYYALQGLAHEFLEETSGRDRAREIADAMDDEGFEEGD